MARDGAMMAACRPTCFSHGDLTACSIQYQVHISIWQTLSLKMLKIQGLGLAVSLRVMSPRVAALLGYGAPCTVNVLRTRGL